MWTDVDQVHIWYRFRRSREDAKNTEKRVYLRKRARFVRFESP